MNNVLENTRYLLGKTPQEVTKALSQDGFSCKFIYTRDPRDSEENVVERVIRIKTANNGLEILIGYFKDTLSLTLSDK